MPISFMRRGHSTARQTRPVAKMDVLDSKAVFPARPRDHPKLPFRRGPLKAAGWWYRSGIRAFTDGAFRRREIAIWREYWLWKERYADRLRPRLTPASSNGSTPRALIVGKETINGAKIELGLIKSFELAGFVPIVLTDRSFAKFYRLAGVTDFLYWEDFTDRLDREAAAETVARLRSIDDLLAFSHAGARVGRFAASSAFRYLRVGRLNLSDRRTRETLIDQLALGMLRARAAGRMLEEVRPRSALLLGNRYTGQSELMDLAIAGGVDVITWFEAHRSNALMLKRYTRTNSDQHHGSLSDATWQLVRTMEWTPELRDELRHEIAHNYASGDWYSRGGTQFGRRIVEGQALRERLGLDPSKKTVCVFPHIVWDATLFWGRDLFDNYQDWLIETLRAASANPRVNWVVKIHPAHVVKDAWEGRASEPAEVAAIREHVGTLPPHVFLIPASTDINTYSLFEIMDCCVTVRGTIGVEAASLGIAVVTAGTGRYDRRGFTIDSETRDEYLDRLARIHELPRPTLEQRNLAERFAYGTFVMRPFSLQTISIDYGRDVQASMKVEINAETSEQLRAAPDLRALAGWLGCSASEDYLERPARAALV
jgi:Capsule polysaccharide biosynthesis protein